MSTDASLTPANSEVVLGGFRFVEKNSDQRWTRYKCVEGLEVCPKCGTVDGRCGFHSSGFLNLSTDFLAHITCTCGTEPVSGKSWSPHMQIDLFAFRRWNEEKRQERTARDAAENVRALALYP